MNWLKEIKWAWQRVKRGYDDRIFWEFDSYFYQFLPAIREFCENELKDTQDGRRKEIYTEEPNDKDFWRMVIEQLYKKKAQIVPVTITYSQPPQKGKVKKPLKAKK